MRQCWDRSCRDLDGELAAATLVGVVDVEPSVVGVVGVEGETEQALLDAAGEDPVREIEERCLLQLDGWRPS